MAENKQCFIYECDNYPRCIFAKGNCCSIEFDEEIPQVRAGECNEKNGYKLFADKGRSFYKPKA